MVVLRALELLVGPCRSTARSGTRPPARYLAPTKAFITRAREVQRRRCPQWHFLASISEPARHAMVCLSLGWRRQEKCHAKSFGVALFAGTRHPATACVDKKSSTPAWFKKQPFRLTPGATCGRPR